MVLRLALKEVAPRTPDMNLCALLSARQALNVAGFAVNLRSRMTEALSRSP